MLLTHFQRNLLVQYQRFHQKPPSFGGLICLYLPAHLMILVATVSGGFFFLANEDIRFAFLLFGIGIGAILRDWATLIRLIRAWPVLSQVFNWEQVRALLQSEDETPNH